MTKVTLTSVSKAVAGRDLFRDLTLEITPGMRLAVLGPNGSGKSTLLRLIAKESDPDSGRIQMPSEIRLGFVTQEMDQDILAEPLLSHVMSSLPSWSCFWREWEKVKDEAQIKQLAKEQAVLESRYGYNPEFQARTVLHGLGFVDAAFDQPLSTFSGGWRERAKLARAIVGGVDILLLDEPTNHLDLEAVLWLEEYLIAFRGVVVFVAHDRLFLDRVATHVLAFGGGKTLFRKGNYRDYVQWRTERDSFLTQQTERIQDEISRKQVFVDRFRYKATKAVQAQSRVNQIDKLKNDLETLAQETIQKDRALSFTWPEPIPAGKVVVSTADLGFSFPGKPLILAGVTLTLMKGQKVALVGPNGTGKTTLLKIIAGEISATSGRVSLSSNTVIGYYSQHQAEILRPGNQVIDEIRRLSQGQSTDAELKSVLGLFLLGERFWEQPVRHLSGGEKARLVLASLFLKRANFLVLDEPTNHLDLESREALIRALRLYTGTILLVAHDRHLLATVAEDIWMLRDHSLTPVVGGLAAYLDEVAATKEFEKGRTAEQIQKSPPRRMDKREQGEIRNRFYRELKPLRDEYARTEAELDESLQRQDALERQLAEPATYGRPEEVGPLQREYYLTRDLTEELFARLSSLEERIKGLDAERIQLLGEDT